MEKCWSQDPKERPVMLDIVQELEDILNVECNEVVQGESSIWLIPWNRVNSPSINSAWNA